MMCVGLLIVTSPARTPLCLFALDRGVAIFVTMLGLVGGAEGWCELENPRAGTRTRTRTRIRAPDVLCPRAA